MRSHKFVYILILVFAAGVAVTLCTGYFTGALRGADPVSVTLAGEDESGKEPSHDSDEIVNVTTAAVMAVGPGGLGDWNRAGADSVAEDAGEDAANRESGDTGDDPDGGEPIAAGILPDAEGVLSDAEGNLPDADGSLSDAERSLPDAEGVLSDAERSLSDAEGVLPDAEGNLSDSEGVLSDAERSLSDAEGVLSDAEGSLSDAEGDRGGNGQNGSSGNGQNDAATAESGSEGKANSTTRTTRAGVAYAPSDFGGGMARPETESIVVEYDRGEPVLESPREAGVGESTDEDNPYYRRLGELDAQIARSRQEQNATGYSGVGSSQAKNIASNELKLWDGELNTIYNEILKHLDEVQTGELVSSERQWMRKRDAAAVEAARNSAGGSLESVEYTASLAESTRARAYELVRTYGYLLTE